MEIEGKIISVLPMRSGIGKSTGTPWASQSFVIETEEQYPKKAVIDVFGEEKIKAFGLVEGRRIKVQFDIDAHEYQGKWYNSLRAWKFEDLDQQAGTNAFSAPNNPQQSGMGMPAQAPVQTSFGGFDDVPF